MSKKCKKCKNGKNADMNVKIEEKRKKREHRKRWNEKENKQEINVLQNIFKNRQRRE